MDYFFMFFGFAAILAMAWFFHHEGWREGHKVGYREGQREATQADTDAKTPAPVSGSES